MFLEALPLVFVLCGLVLYAVLAGADFGAGLWQLIAGRGPRGQAVREHAHAAIGPVWEANHVWLIFVLTVFWTAYPKAFGSIASTLAVPLFIAVIGIIFRGAAYALRAGAASEREAGAIDTIFAVSSILTPFSLGAAVGAIATGRVPVGNAAGHLFSSWLNPTAAFIGAVAVSNGAYLAAVYLAADAARSRDRALERAFRLRALGAGVIAGAVALAGLLVLRHDDHALFHALVHGRALAAVAVSVVAGAGTLALVSARRYEPARYGAALAVAAIVAGWALARWPTILPRLTVGQAAAGHETLVAVVIAVIAGAVILLPSLGLLFRLTLTGRLGYDGAAAPAPAVPRARTSRPAALARTAAGTFVAGLGLLTLDDAAWAHAVALACLLCFALTCFGAIVATAVDQAGAGEAAPDANAAGSQPGAGADPGSPR